MGAVESTAESESIVRFVDDDVDQQRGGHEIIDDPSENTSARFVRNDPGRKKARPSF